MSTLCLENVNVLQTIKVLLFSHIMFFSPGLMLTIGYQDCICHNYTFCCKMKYAFIVPASLSPFAFISKSKKNGICIPAKNTSKVETILLKKGSGLKSCHIKSLTIPVSSFKAVLLCVVKLLLFSYSYCCKYSNMCNN